MSDVAINYRGNIDICSVERGFFEFLSTALTMNGIQIIRVEGRNDGDFDLLVKRQGAPEKYVTVFRAAVDQIINRGKLDELLKEFDPLVPQFIPDPRDLNLPTKA